MIPSQISSPLPSLQKDISQNELLSIYRQSPSLQPEIRLLLSDKDEEFVQGLNQSVHVRMSATTPSMTLKLSVPSSITTLLLNYVVERVGKVVKEGGDRGILNKVLLFTRDIDDYQVPSLSVTLQRLLVERVLAETNLGLFSTLMRHVRFNGKNPELQTELLGLLTLGYEAYTDPSLEQRVKQRFTDIQSKDELKYLHLLCMLYLSVLNQKFTISSAQSDELLAEFRVERNETTQNLFEIALDEGIPAVTSLAEYSINSKLMVTPKVQYDVSPEEIHPSFITKENIILFMNIINDTKHRQELDLYIGRGSVVENQSGVYFKFPVEAYPKPQKIEVVNVFDQLPAFFDFIKLVLKSINESKHMYTPFQELNIKQKIQLLSFAFDIISYLPEYQSDEEPYDYTELVESGVIAGGLETVIKIIETNDNREILPDLKVLVYLLFQNCLTFYVNPNSLLHLTNGKLVENIYKIVTGYKVSSQLTTDILALYQKGFKEILKSLNKTQQFQTPLLFQKLIESYMNEKIQKKKINKLIEHFIIEHANFEPVLRKQITERIEQLSQRPSTYFDDPQNDEIVSLQVEKLTDLLNLRNLKHDSELSKVIQKFLFFKFTLNKYSSYSSILIQHLHKDIVMSAETFQSSINESLDLLNSEEYKASLTFQNLIQPVTLVIHTHLFNKLHFIINYIKHQEKDTHGVYATLYQKLFELNLLLSQQQFSNIQLVKNHLKGLTGEQLSQFKLTLNKALLFKENTFLEYLDGVKCLLNLQMESLLKPYSKVSIPAPSPAKVPLHPFIKQFGQILNIIGSSSNKEEIIYYIQLLVNTLGPNRAGMSVQSYYYLFVEFQSTVFKIANKLFSDSKNHTYIQHSLSVTKSTYMKDLIIAAGKSQEKQQEILQKQFSTSISDFLNVFLLRQLQVVPWIIENVPEEPKYNNTKNLALGIILEQFTQLIKNLSKDNIVLYEDLLKEFLTPNIEKTHIIDYDGSNTNRRGNNLRAQRQVTEVLISMGYRPQVAELALNQLEEVNIEGALEWLADHHDELDLLEEEMILNLSRQRSLNKQKSSSSQSQSKHGLQEIQLQKFNSQYMTQLKSLFSQHLLPGLYGKYRNRMPQLIIHCIERFDKEESRNKNYKNLINHLIKELNLELESKTKNKELNEERASVQLSNLELIIQKCSTKKDIRDQALDSNLMSNLLLLLEHYLQKEKLEGQEEANIKNIVNIIYSLIPKKSSMDILVELDSIIDKLVLVKQKFECLNGSKAFWAIISTRLDSKISDSRVNLILDQVFRDIQTPDIAFNPGDIIESILNSDPQFVSANIESQIKAYFFSESEAKLVSKPKRDFLLHFERYNTNELFYQITKMILKKKTEKLHNNKKVVYLIYAKEKESYTESIVLKKPFIEYRPSKVQKSILQKLYSSLSLPQDSKTLNKFKLDLLHRIIDHFPLLQHYLLLNKYQSSTLLQLILSKIPQYKQSIANILTLLGTKTGVMINQKGTIMPYSYYLQYLIIQSLQRIISKQITSTPSPIYLSLCYLLSFSHFNDLSHHPISPTIPSLKSTLQQHFTTTNQSISQPLMLIYKKMTFNAISHLYTLMDPQNLSTFQSQLIYLPLIYSQILDEASASKNLRLLRNQLSLEIDNIRDANSILHITEGNIPRLIELFRGNNPLQEFNLDFLPIQPKSERKESKVSNQAEGEKNAVEQVVPTEEIVPKVRYLSDEYDEIKVLYETSQIPEQKAQSPEETKPNFSKLKASQNPSPIRQYRITYSTKFNEAFLQRLNTLWKNLTDTSEKQNQGQESPKDPTAKKLEPQPDNLTTFLRNNYGEDAPIPINPRMMRERLVVQENLRLHELNVRRRENQQQVQLNQNQIESVLEEYVEEKVKQPEVEKVEKKEEKPVEKVEEKKEEAPSVPVPKSQDVVVQPEVPEKAEQQPKEAEKKEQKVQQNKAEKEEKSEQKSEQKTEQKEGEKEQQKPQEQPVPPTIPPVVVPNPPAAVAPPRYRQLLQLIGVSQHFLRNNGVDEQQFDSWSEQIQTQTLFQLISMQNEPRPEESKNQEPQPYIEQDILQNIPAEVRDEFGFGLYTETALLLASIDDPEMREQIFLQASPEIISTLPLELQQEAEGVRQRRMREIAAEEEEEYNNNLNHRRKPRRNKENLIYPTVSKELFKGLSEEILFKILNTLFYKQKSSNTMLLESCLENKQNQETLINTIIYILRNPLQAPEFPSQIKELINGTETVVPNGSKVLTELILEILLKIARNSSYKDVNFLKQKLSYKCVKGITLTPNSNLLIENIVTEEFHYPYIELLTYSLSSNLNLSAYLLEGYSPSTVPQVILQKIIQTFKSDTLPQDFVNSLKSLSDNKQLKELFRTSFTQKNHPKIGVLAQLLKYPFARVDYLKDLHFKILKTYKPQYNKFLNQIYRIYTLQELKSIKSQLQPYKQVHKQVIKEVISHSNIFTEPISIILKLPFLIDFETKREIFYQRVQTWNEEGGYVGRLELRIDRMNLFSGSFSQIYPRTKEEMRGKLNITFEDEGAYDAGGLTRQWFLIISKQMFNQDYALFEQSSSGNTYHPSSKSYINPDHLRYFKFIGRVVGKALMQKCLIDAYFTRSFYKLILGQDLTLSDMESSDFNFYTSMMWIKNNKIEDDFYRFAYDIQNFGKIETIELVKDGKNVEVTDGNKHEFVEKICEVKMKTETQEQIKAFLEGFHELIPLESIQYFTAEELELLMSGLPSIELEDLKQNTDYQGYQPTDKAIIWFWQILETFDQEQLAKVVQFITGTSKIPPEGFKGLKGMHGGQKVSIHKHFSVNQLPQSHTCFNQLDLPEYGTKEVMEKMLRTALKWGSESFGFM